MSEGETEVVSKNNSKNNNNNQQFNPKNISIYLPNEILNDFINPITEARTAQIKSNDKNNDKNNNDKNSKVESSKTRIMTHVAFAYSYYYYITYLYRYCKFYDNNGNKVTQKEIKKTLGYSPVYKHLDYIIKRGGILDLLGYTETTTNIPLMWNVDDFNQVNFTTSKQMSKGSFKNSDRNFSGKKPIKAFYRNEESIRENVQDGTFFDTRNTHKIPFQIFKEFMKKEKLQTVGFYLYGYLVHMCNMYNNEFQASYSRIAKETGLHRTTVVNYLNAMEDEELINVVHQEFKFDREDNEEKLANIYSIEAA